MTTQSQTPETDAEIYNPIVGGIMTPSVSVDFARKLERERDEARQQTAQGNEVVYRWRKLVSDAEAERDQLIKVVDEVVKHLMPAHNKAWCLQQYGNLCSHHQAIEAYSLLPHVLAKKGTK